jgi:uncharacterized integral membrane protein
MSDQDLQTAGKGSTPAKRSNAENSRLAAALVLGGLLAVFALLNTDKVEVNWILGTWETPLIIVIVVSLGLGVATGYLLARRGARAKRRKA